MNKTVMAYAYSLFYYIPTAIPHSLCTLLKLAFTSGIDIPVLQMRELSTERWSLKPKSL